MRPMRTTSSSSARMPRTPIHVWTQWPIRGARRPCGREVATAVLMKRKQLCPFASIAFADVGRPVAVGTGRGEDPRAMIYREAARMPDDAPTTTEAQLRRTTIGALRRHDGPVMLAEPDPAWPALFAREERRIRAALGERVLLVEHAGSTAVPGLPAKPV